MKGVQKGTIRVMNRYRWKVTYVSVIDDTIITEKFTTATQITLHPIFSKFFKTRSNVYFHEKTRDEKERSIKVEKINEPIQKFQPVPNSQTV